MVDSSTTDTQHDIYKRCDDPFNQDLINIRMTNDVENSTTGSGWNTGKNDIHGKPPAVPDRFRGRFCCLCRYWISPKFGTWDGVYLSCLLSMFGVIMFLRLGFIVGQAGVWQTWLIEFISAAVVLVTTLSMSALSSNGEVSHGGAYFLISRSLGPEIGGSIGVLFTLGNSIAVSMHILGFAETLIKQLGRFTTNSLTNDMRLYGCVVLVVLLALAFVGVGWLIKIQILIAVLLVATVVCFLVGSVLTRDGHYLVVGMNKGAFAKNFGGAYTEGFSFVSVFAIFFPAMTGIMAGANLSGDLKEPAKNISVGTLSAVVTAWAIYTGLSTVLSDAVLRGDSSLCGMEDPSRGICYNLIMEVVSIPKEIVYVGIYAATLSSAIAALIGAPRILMTVGNDNILKALRVFGRVRENGEPLYAYIPVALVATGCISIGNLNTTAKIVTVTYLLTYALINFACFQSSTSKSPGWRPKFHFYNQWVALTGFVSCITLIFVIDYVIAIPACIATFMLYLFIYRKRPKVDWGSAIAGVAEMTIVKHLLSQHRRSPHVKNFRPNIMFFTNNPSRDNNFLTFLYTLRHGHGANFIGVLRPSPVRGDDDDFFVAKVFERNFVLFKKSLASSDYFRDAFNTLSMIGIGRIKPNTVLVEYPQNFTTEEESRRLREEFFCFVNRASASKFGLMTAANFKRLDFHHSDPFGTVDIWLLYRDGGLTILLAHILSKSSFWQRNSEGGGGFVPIRLFAITKKDEDIDKLYHILKSFRLDYIEIKPVFPKSGDKLSNRWDIIAKLMRQHSKRAKLVFCTMSNPNEALGADYFCDIIEEISEDMPAMILVNGCGREVLTGCL